MSKHSRAILGLVISLAIFLTLVNRVSGLRPVRLILDQVFNPIARIAESSLSHLRDGVKLITSVGSLNSQNKQLTSEVAQLKTQLASLREVSVENDLLRKQFNVASQTQLDLAPARVVAYDPDNLRRYITIDHGSRAGLKVGMAVISSGSLVGEIDQINDFSARVFLLSDPDFRIRALGQDNRASGIVSGQLGQGYIMQKIAQNETITTGETIISAGTDLVPRGLVIGEVEGVNRSDNAIFQEASLRPEVDLTKLELVFVVRGSS